MAGAHILSTLESQRSIAGMTRSGASSQVLPPALTGGEALSLTGLRSELGGMLSGGIHPETVLAPVSRALEDLGAKIGPHGGMVPSLSGPSAPGPAGETLAVRGRAALARLQSGFRSFARGL
jgi:hypothetical protein